MPDKTDYENRQLALAENICNLLCNLDPSSYDEIKPKVEFWINYVLDEQFATAVDLADRVLSVAWTSQSSGSDISRFLKEFRDAPQHSKHARPFVDELCSSILRWFSVASSEDLWANWHKAPVSKNGGPGFIRAASFVGHLAECGLLDREPVRRHIFKPLMFHYYNKSSLKKEAIKAHAIYALFETAGKTLLQGLLEPEEVQDCFEMLETRVSFGEIVHMERFDAEKLKAFRKIHTKWLQQRKEEEQRNTTTVEVLAPGKVDTPVALTPQNLPSTRMGVVDTSPLQRIESLPMLRNVEFASDTLIDSRFSTASSPTLSISTISDLTPTELDAGESSDENTPTRHESFYFEDGNVEIMCGRTIFRVHCSIVSFSSPKLRDILSPSTLLNAPKPEGCPRIVFNDNAEDFAILMKMISTPWLLVWHKVPEFTIFASLLRMATKYGFLEVREQLLHSLKGAYPTELEAYRTASVLGEDVFGSPKPHPNLVLNLFLEQSARFAIPVAAYRAALGGFSSLVSSEPGMALPRLTLASIFYGMDTMRSEVSQRAYSIICSMSSKPCHRGECIDSPEERMEGLNKIYDFVVKWGTGDVFSSLSLSSRFRFCADCAAPAEEGHNRLCAKIWKNLPRIFRVGENWEEPSLSRV